MTEARSDATAGWRPAVDGRRRRPRDALALVAARLAAAPALSRYAHATACRDLAWLSELLLLSADAEGRVKLWRTPRGGGREARFADRRLGAAATLYAHSRAVNAVAVAPCGARFATASDDATVRLWDASRLPPPPAANSAAPELQRPDAAAAALGCLHHAAAAEAVAFDELGSLLLSGDADGELRVWAGADTRAPAAKLHLGGGAVASASFGPGGAAQVALAAGAGGIALFDLRALRDEGGACQQCGSTRPRRTMPFWERVWGDAPPPPASPASPPRGARWAWGAAASPTAASPAGAAATLVAASPSAELPLWRFRCSNRSTAVVFSRAARRYVTPFTARRPAHAITRSRSAPLIERRHARTQGHAGDAAGDAQFSADGALVLSCGLPGSSGGGSEGEEGVKVWGARTGEGVCTLRAPAGAVSTTRLSRARALPLLAAGASDGVVRCWRVDLPDVDALGPGGDDVGGAAAALPVVAVGAEPAGRAALAVSACALRADGLALASGDVGGRLQVRSLV